MKRRIPREWPSGSRKPGDRRGARCRFPRRSRCTGRSFLRDAERGRSLGQGSYRTRPGAKRHGPGRDFPPNNWHSYRRQVRAALVRQCLKAVPTRAFRAEKNPTDKGWVFGKWWWGGTLRQTYVTQRLTTDSNSCGKVRNPASTANNPTSCAPRQSPVECVSRGASSIPIYGIEPASTIRLK